MPLANLPARRGRDHHFRPFSNRGRHHVDRHTVEAEDNADEADHHAHGENWLAISGINQSVDNHAPDDPKSYYAGQDQQYQPVAEGERALDDFILLFAENSDGFVDADSSGFFSRAEA